MIYKGKIQYILALILLNFYVVDAKLDNFKSRLLLSHAALELCKKKFEKSDGFLAGTLVKTPDGYRPIEELAVGDIVISYDFDGKQTQSKIIDVQRKTVKSFARLNFGQNSLCAAVGQRFFLPEKERWIKAKNIALSSRVFAKSDEVVCAQTIELCQEECTLYAISLEKHHNFCVTKDDILVHNIAPAVGIGLTFLFVSEGIELAGAFIGIGVGGLLFKVFGWNRNNREEQQYQTRQIPVEEPKDKGIGCAKPIPEKDKDNGIGCAKPIPEPAIPTIMDNPIDVGLPYSGIGCALPIPEPIVPNIWPGREIVQPKIEDMVLLVGPKAWNMKQLLNETPLGAKLYGKIEKTHIINNEQPVYKVTEKIKELGLKKGDHFYIDKESYMEIEVFDGAEATSKHKAVIRTDGTINHEKTERAKGRKF